jgi:hypothetical protein
VRLAQGLLVVLQRGNVRPHGHDPPVRQHRVLDPESAAVDQIGLEGFLACTPAPRKGPGDQGFDVTVVDPDTEPMRSTMPKDVGKGKRPLVAGQEHTSVGLVRVAEVVIGCESAPKL